MSCLADAVSDLVDSRARLVSGDLNVTVQRVRRALARPVGLHGHVAVLLFWGRQQYTSVLRPYLERELVTNGGVVDEVWLCMTTPKRSDLQAGRRWAAATPQVHAFNAVANTTGGNFNYCYEHLPSHAAAKAGWQLQRTLLLKVDDDVVFVDRGALAYLAAHKMFHRSAAFRRRGIVIANVVNHGHLPFLHAALGTWTPRRCLGYFAQTALPEPALRLSGELQHVAFLQHLRDSLRQDPLSTGDSSGADGGRGGVHHGRGLEAYWFGSWDLNACNCTGLVPQRANRCAGGRFYRWGINVVAISAASLLRFPDDNDEWWITAGWQTGISQEGRAVSIDGIAPDVIHAEVAGKAVVVHYAYSRQRQGKIDADGCLLRQYGLLARNLGNWSIAALGNLTCSMREQHSARWGFAGKRNSLAGQRAYGVQ